MRKSERGATLLTVLMFVALMSAVAVGVTTSLSGSIGLSRAANARGDVYWTARSAVTASEVIVSGMFVDGTKRWPFPEAAAPEPVVVQFGAGQVSLSFEDASNCFNLNALVDDSGLANSAQVQTFARVMTGLGEDASRALALASTAADWIDADDAALSGGAESGWYMDAAVAHATSGKPFVSLSELRALRGYEPDLLDVLIPHLCLGKSGQPGRLNLNTLVPEHATVLAGLFSTGLDLKTARQIIEERPVSGWQTVEEFLSLPDIARLGEDIRNPAVLSVETTRIRSRLTVRIGNQNRVFTIMFDREGDGPFRSGRLEEVVG